MGKNYYLSYNEITKHYFLDEGRFNKNRVDLGVCHDFKTLENLLKKKVEPHRKGIAIINLDFPNQYREILKDFFEQNQIKVLFQNFNK